MIVAQYTIIVCLVAIFFNKLVSASNHLRDCATCLTYVYEESKADGGKRLEAGQVYSICIDEGYTAKRELEYAPAYDLVSSLITPEFWGVQSLIWPDGNYTYPEVLNQTLTYYLASHNAEVLTRETWEEKAKKWCDKWEPGTKGSYNWVHINGNKRKLATEACKVLGQFTVKAMCMKVVEKGKPKNDGHDELKKRQSF